jgi:hypothetical protein
MTQKSSKKTKVGNGIYISLPDGGCILPHQWEKEMGSLGVILITDYASIVIAKEDRDDMPWGEAVAHNPFSRHEAIEIHENKATINAALELIGGKPVRKTWYWTRDECSTNAAWFYGGTFGSLNYTGKTSSSAVRPVTAFKNQL